MIVVYFITICQSSKSHRVPQHPSHLFIPLCFQFSLNHRLTRDRKWDVVSLIWKSPSVLRRPCVGVTPSRVAGEENRCRAAASRAARTFLCLHRPAGGGGAAGGWLPRCAASRRIAALHPPIPQWQICLPDFSILRDERVQGKMVKVQREILSLSGHFLYLDWNKKQDI